MTYLSRSGVFPRSARDEELLERSDTGFLLSRTEPSYADLALFVELLELSEDEHVPDFADVFHLPRLGAFLETTRARPRLDAYLRSPRRMPRYARPGVRVRVTNVARVMHTV